MAKATTEYEFCASVCEVSYQDCLSSKNIFSKSLSIYYWHLKATGHADTEKGERMEALLVGDFVKQARAEQDFTLIFCKFGSFGFSLVELVW